ncbi:MAG: hypothetical protein ACRDBG_17705, partial [Waterburya sp.]
TGKGSNINISARKLLTQERAEFGTAAYDSAQGGDVIVNVSESVDILNGLGMGSVTRGSGKAGSVNLSTEYLKVTNGGQVASTTFGTGAGGQVDINADFIELVGISQTGNVPSLLGTSTFGTGVPGDVTVNTSQLRLIDGGYVTSNSLADGSTGNVTVNSSKFIEVIGKQGRYPSTIGSSVLVLSEEIRNRNQLPDEPKGVSGSLTINSPSITVGQEGEISVKNEGTGNAGILTINTENLNLESSGNVTAASAFGQGGNININTDNLQIDENSSIAATANNNGDGGNITINTTSLIAKKNSQVTANAFNGRGGNIDINAEGLFLFDSPQNIFSASSELGIDGTIQINTPDIDLQRELEQSELELPTTEEAVAGSCLARSNRQGSFTVNNDTGLPKSPNSNYSDIDSTLTGISSLPATAKQPEATEQSDAYGKPSDALRAGDWRSQQNTSMLPAERMVKTRDGKVFLVAAPYAKRYPLGQEPESLFCPKN